MCIFLWISLSLSLTHSFFPWVYMSPSLLTWEGLRPSHISLCRPLHTFLWSYLPLSTCLCHSTLSSFSTPHQSHIWFSRYISVSIQVFYLFLFPAVSPMFFFSWLHFFSLLVYLCLSQLPGSFPQLSFSALGSRFEPQLCFVSHRGEPCKSLSFLWALVFFSVNCIKTSFIDSLRGLNKKIFRYFAPSQMNNR